MEKIKELQTEYKKYLNWGYNRIDAINNAVDLVFKGQVVNPHIYKDEYGDYSHVYYQKYVLLDGEIYLELE